MKKPSPTAVALLQETIADVTPQDCAAYASGSMLGPLGLLPPGEKASKEFLTATLKFAAVGWAFFHGVDELGERRRAAKQKPKKRKAVR